MLVYQNATIRIVFDSMVISVPPKQKHSIHKEQKEKQEDKEKNNDDENYEDIPLEFEVPIPFP